MTPMQDDIDRIMAVMQAGFDPVYGEAWTRRQVEDALLVGQCHYCLANAEGDEARPDEVAVGFFLSRTGYEEEELLLIAVAPDYRGRSIGRKLLEILAHDARERGAHRLLLEMRRGNPAESLYRSFGFQPIGERLNYYHLTNGNHLDAITFACPLE